MADKSAQAPAAPAPPQPKSLGIIKPPGHVSSVRFSPCGTVMVAPTFYQDVRRWDLRTGAFPPPEMSAVTGHNGYVTGVDFHPTRLLAFSADSWGQVRSWPYQADKVNPYWTIEHAHDGWIRDLNVSKDGELLVTCGRDQLVKLFSTIDGTLVQEIDGHREDVFAIAIHPSRQWVVSADLMGRIYQWDIRTGQKVKEFNGTKFHQLDRLQDIAGIRKIYFDPAGERLFVSGMIPIGGGNVRGHGHIAIYNFASGEIQHSIPFGEAEKDIFVHDSWLHPKGYLVAVTTGQPGQGNLFLHRPGEAAPFFALNKGTVNCHSAAISPDGNRLVVSATNTGSNGNGRRLDKEGGYEDNHSPLHVFDITGIA